MAFRKVSEDEFVVALERHALTNKGAVYEIVFPEGDAYLCQWDNGEYVDNDEDMDSLEQEEWYELDYWVKETLKPNPNWDPRYGYIQVSSKHVPALVKCGDEVLYQA